MNFKRFFSILFFVLCYISMEVYAGFVEKQKQKTVIHVKVLQLPDPANNSAQNQAEIAVINRFIEKFPGIFTEKYRNKYKTQPEKYGNFNWDDVRIKLTAFNSLKVEGVETDLLAIAGGLAPDILYINFRKSDNYIRNNFLYPLNEYYKTLSQNQIDFRINKKLWPVIRRKGPQGKNVIWAMPYGGTLGKVLLYRKDLFDERNIAYPDKNWTWTDLLEAAKKISDPEKGIYGMLLGRGKKESFHWMSFLWSAGGEAMIYDKDKNQWKCVFDSSEAVMALDFYTKLSAEKWIDRNGKIRRGYSSKDVADSSAKWNRGEIGMMFNNIDEKLFVTIDPEVVGLAPVPLGPTGKRGAELNSRMMGLFSGIKSPAVRDAAWEYIRFVTSIEAEKIRTKIMVEGGLGRFVNPKYLRMFGYPEVERLAPKGWSEIFDVAIETGKPEPYGKNSNYAYEMMTYPLQEAENLAIHDRLPQNKEKRYKLLTKILKKACAEANEKMIGIIPSQERSKRRTVAICVMLLIFSTFAFVFYKIMKVFSPSDKNKTDRNKGFQFKKYAWGYVLLLPALILILTWKYVPLFRGSTMAFFDYKLIGQSIFVGVDNFGDVLFNAKWWEALYNSFRYSFLILTMTFVPPIILAVFLQEIPKGKILFRTIYYLPAVVTGIVTVLLWKMFYAPSESGMLNGVMLSIPAIVFIAIGIIFMLICFMFGSRLKFYELRWQAFAFIILGCVLFYVCSSITFPIFHHTGESFVQAVTNFPRRLFCFIPEPYNWLSDRNSAMVACVIPMIWAGMGPGCLIYLAALKGIPDDYYEAADIDGATFIDKLLFVVFPMLKMLIIINFVGAFIASWYGATANILALTGGGAGTETAGLHIWYSAFTFLKLGPATAMAWMLGFMLIGFTVHQLRILSKVEFRTTGKK